MKTEKNISVDNDKVTDGPKSLFLRERSKKIKTVNSKIFSLKFVWMKIAHVIVCIVKINQILSVCFLRL
jgi:hypothetical protein